MGDKKDGKFKEKRVHSAQFSRVKTDWLDVIDVLLNCGFLRYGSPMSQPAFSTSTEGNLNLPELKSMADCVRVLGMDMVHQAQSGHQGMPMGMADIAAVLMRHFLRFNPKEPAWLGRDRLVISNGHGSALLYALLHLTGYDVSLDDLKNFRQLHSKTPGHPEFGETVGVETTTGPLGQGIANAVGMALGQKMLAARFGESLFNNKIYVTVGDGCLMEGISHEACELAAHWKLDNLVVLFDDNAITIDGKTDLASSTQVKERMKAYGFDVLEADGHNSTEVFEVLSAAQTATMPTFIAFKTTIGYGSPQHKGTSAVHGYAVKNNEDSQAVRDTLAWPHEPFDIPQDIYSAWQAAAENGKRDFADWQKAFQEHDEKQEMAMFFRQNMSAACEKLDNLKKQAAESEEKMATRKASGQCIKVFAEEVPQIVSGSADLSGSNNTQTGGACVSGADYSGNYIYYGVREHGMGAIMNGLSLSGFVALGGTFLTFADYTREPIRLAAMMKQGSVFVMTHDSIGVGEDGPTHQPVEHLAMLRATPGLNVFRPADLIETAECWQLALENRQTPSVMVLTRQGLPAVRTTHVEENLTAKGGYVLKDCDNPDVILIATGSEVYLALEAQEKLAETGVAARVVSMPCWRLFDEQPQSYKDEVLPPKVTKRIAVEAAIETGWHKYIGLEGIFVGMEGFGASAPAHELFQEFGITAEAIVEAVKA